MMRRFSNLCITTILGLTLAACAPPPTYRQHDTPACMHYRAMMTAPMPPDAMHRLQAQCDASRQRGK
ncbi:hypothetical protein FYB92_03120 [Novacetimonas sp. GS1]